jgi:hypothetical protein
MPRARRAPRRPGVCLLLTDLFTSSPFRVDVERDLSVKRQLQLQEKTISADV